MNTESAPSSDPNPETRTPKPASRIKRWLRRLGRIVIIAYIGLAVLLALLQTQLIFPGAATQGSPDSAVDPKELDAELVTLTTPGGGGKVVALFGRALDANGKPHPDARSRPTLIYFYGNAMCIAAAVEGGEFYEFRRRGFNVMIPDYLGYGMSTGKPSEAGVYATADACFDHLKQRGDAGEIDPQKIVPLGLSLGGGAAFHLAATRQREIPCVATIAAFTSVDAMARKLFPYLPTGMILKHHFDNESNIRKFGKPVFLAHGTRDGIIPFAMSQKLADAATAGGAKVVKYDIPDGDHNDIYDIGGPALLDAITRFVNEHAAKAAERAQAEGLTLERQ